MPRFRPRKGTFPSIKLGINVHYGSSIERDFMFWLEYWKHVKSYRIYPFTIEWILDDVSHEYTPDFDVDDTVGKSIVECEHINFVNTPEAIQQQRIGNAWSQANQHSFILATSDDIRKGHGLESIRILWKYARTKVSPVAEGKIINIVHKYSEITLDQLLSILSPDDKTTSLPSVCSLLFAHKIETDVHQKFDLNWIIRP